MFKVRKEYPIKETITYKRPGATVTVTKLDLPPDEYRRRMKLAHDAAAEIIIAARELERKEKEAKNSEKSTDE